MKNEQLTMLRQRRQSKLSKVKQIDIFPKIQDPYKQTTTVGGLCIISIISFLVILWLLYSEIIFYMDSKFVFKFSPDTDLNSKLKINIDITVAMRCDYIGADILDSTGQNEEKFGSLQTNNTWFELDSIQKTHFENKRHFNTYLREEYHAIKDLLWRSSFSSSFGEMPERRSIPNQPPDACRIHGSLILNKVAGNFHVTMGQTIHLPSATHIHLSSFTTEQNYNFSHRINKFNFGDPSPGIVHSLEGDELISENRSTVFNYFIEVVPTKVDTFLTQVDTYQYSVKELTRPIDHEKGSHGMPGIYFKYDMSALKVTIKQERDHLGMFLAKLCSTISGIYVCSGFLSRLVFLIIHIFSKTKPENAEASKAHLQSVPDVVPSIM